MKLLYIWINRSANGYIEKKGFNIAGEFFWKYDEKNRVLSYIKKEGYIKNFWNEDNDSIEDLSVIVGTNGSGKSTLLAEIMKYGVIVPNNLYGEVNSRAKMHRQITEKKIVVYEEEGYIYYDHNLEYEIETFPVVVKKKKDVLKDCTKIYVSNSINNPVTSASFQEDYILNYVLADYNIQDQSKIVMRKNEIPDYVYVSEEKGDSRYYDDPATHRTEASGIERVRKLNEKINLNKNSYSDLNSLIRLYFLVKAKCKKYAGKKYEYVTIKTKNEIDVFDIDDIDIVFGSSDEIWRTITSLEGKEKSNLLNSLITYFLYEYKFCFEYETINEISLNQVKEIKKYLQHSISRNINDSLQENMTTMEYFINTANDILLFDKLVLNNKDIYKERQKENKYYLGDLQVNLYQNQEFFDRLFLFLERGIPSFFMRYLTFEFEGMSSGEEAMMNLYSRIFWIYNAQNCKKESLILIDEIDLYMHPKWQRELISYLVEDIPNLIGKENRAQIIITTHSPIILSDIPRANTIFLENKKGKCIVGINRAHRNTFGNNVHTLFLDSFFLDEEGTMGAFAEKRINTILKLLRSEKKINDENKRILKTISCIGDELIRNKLLELYEKNQGMEQRLKKKQTIAENTAIDNTINMLKSQVGELLHTIEQLEQMKND